METIKMTLVNIKGKFKEQAVNWKDNWHILINVNSQKLLPQRKG